VAGGAAEALFAVGILGAGLLAIPVLAGSGSSALAAFAGRPWGYSRSVRDAGWFYVLVAITAVGGAVVAASGISPVSLLLFGATVNGLTAAPLLVLVLLVASDRSVLGDERPGTVLLALGWVAVALLGVTAAVTVATAI